jgi:hypothetical protein
MEHRMPSGASCFYRDSDHSYWLGIEPKKKRTPDGDWKGCGRLTGVSTVANPFDFNPENLMRWAARTNGIGIAMLAAPALALDEADVMKAELAWLEDDRTIWRALEQARLTFNDVRDIAAERGTNVHKHALHALATGKTVPDYAELTEEEHGYAQGVASFWLEHDPEPLQAEQVVMDPDMSVAGRLDLRARLKARCRRPGCPCAEMPAGGVSLIDVKTSGYLPLKHHVQIAGYDHCAQTSGFGASDAAWILQVDAEGGWKLVPCRATREDFELAVNVYRRAAQIGNAARADRMASEG